MNPITLEWWKSISLDNTRYLPERDSKVFLYLYTPVQVALNLSSDYGDEELLLPHITTREQVRQLCELLGFPPLPLGVD